MEKKVNSIKETFNEVINDFISIIEYDELDLLKFLNIKKEGKYYNLLTKKILLYVIYYVIIMSQSFVLIKLDLLISIIVSMIITIIGYKILDLADHIDEISRKKFKFTINFYKRERKDLLDYQVQINLLFNNQYLLKIIESEIKPTYNKKIKQMNKRLENYKNAIKPITYKIKQYGLIGIFISFIFGFFTNFLIQYLQNPEIIIPLLLFGLLLPAINFFIFGLLYYLLKKRKNRILYNYRSWLQITKSLLSSNIKDLISLLYSVEFSNLDKSAIDTLSELKSKIKKEMGRVEKKIEETKKGLKALKERVQILKKEKKVEELESVKLEKRRLKEVLKNIREERKFLKDKLKP